MENHFNLVEEPWIPVADVGSVSLRDVFANPHHRSLGGNPVQKIAVLKLLLAIAQAAETPDDEAAWKTLGADGLARSCLAYLEQWHDRFYLYGDKPFLQLPDIRALVESRTAKRLNGLRTEASIREAKLNGLPRAIGSGIYPDLPSENNTFLSHTLSCGNLTDAEVAMFIVTLMNFAFGGKRVEADMPSLAGRALGNRYSAKAGPSLGGWSGQLHCFALSGNIRQDIWLNTITRQDIVRLNRWSHGLGSPPWEKYPKSECDDFAVRHKNSYQGCLVALSRFVLLDRSSIYYLDGINYPSVKEGWFEPSLILNNSSNEVKVKYVDPDRQPWRELQSLLSFAESDHASGFECFSLRKSIERARDNIEYVAVWTSGLKVTSNSGDQSVKQSDDFVESVVWLRTADLGASFILQLKSEMSRLEVLANQLHGRVVDFFKEQQVNGKKVGTKIGAQATHLFWQLCERDFQSLVDHCEVDDESVAMRHRLRKIFAGYAQQAYDRFCPKETARQLDAWAKCRPNTHNYLQQEA